VRLRTLLAAPALVAAIAISAPAQAQKPPAPTKVEVFKTATCGCCGKWVEHLKTEGFDVSFKDIDQAELDKVKAKYGVPREAHSCHTAVVGPYVVEGHVPASEIKKIMKDRPAVVGIAVPGMPLGSPGMEVSGVKPQPYNVLSIDKQGRTQVFSTIRP
jgi:hypothetical protein